MKRQTIIQSMAALLILVFVYAAFSKLLNYPLFVAQLEMHPLLKHFAGFLAWALPAAEIIVAICLFIPRIRFLGFIGATLLMILFTTYIAFMLVSLSQLPCSCGGLLKEMTWKQHLVFNIIFTVLAFTGYYLEKSKRSFAQNSLHTSPP